MKRSRNLIAAAVVAGLFAGGLAEAAIYMDISDVRLVRGKLVLGLKDGSSWTPIDGVFHNEDGDRITMSSGGIIAWQPAGQSTKDKITATKVEKGTKILFMMDGSDRWIQMPDGLWEYDKAAPKLRVEAGRVVSLQLIAD